MSEQEPELKPEQQPEVQPDLPKPKFKLKRTFNDEDENELDNGSLLQTISTIKEIWKAFMKTHVVYLTSNDRVAAIGQYFKHSSRVQYPIAFMSQTSLAFDDSLGLSAKNLARSGTGHGISFANNSATISKAFLLPSRISFDFTIYFDDEYAFIKWQEKALLYLATRSLGAVLTHRGFTYDVHQKEAVNEISTPVKEPDQVPMPNAIEATLSLTFTCRIGGVKEVAKFNNENHLTQNLSIQGAGGSYEVVEEDFNNETDAHMPRTQNMSRKEIQQQQLRRT